MTGLYISFLGIDGIGKTTLSRAAVARLRSAGVRVETVTWRGVIETGKSGWKTEALQELWLDSFRLLFAGSVANGEEILLPRTYTEWSSGEWESRLGHLEVGPARPSGPVAAALAELAGNIILTEEVIRPLVDSGAVVVQDTFPFKHVLKELMIADRLRGEAPKAHIVRIMNTLNHAIFSAPSMRPDVGVLVDGDVELAHAWRMAESGSVGLLEDLRAAGEHGKDGFIDLQKRSAERFREVAAEWGWIHHHVKNAPIEANVERGLKAMFATEPLVRLMSESRSG